MVKNRFTPKTLEIGLEKKDYKPEDLIGIVVGTNVIDEDKCDDVYAKMKDSPRFPGTSYIFKDTLDIVFNTMSYKQRKARAMEIVDEIKNVKGLGDYDINEGNKLSSPGLRKIVELERELRTLGF